MLQSINKRQPAISISPSISPSTRSSAKSVRIGLYGGSFDPPTKGHENLCRYLIQNNLVDQVWILPCLASYSGKKMSSYTHRIEMCQLLISNLKSEKKNDEKWVKSFFVSPFEEDHQCFGETIETLEKILVHYDGLNYDFRFIIGMDNALSISTWSGWEKLISLCPFIIFRRGGVVHKSDEKSYAEGIIKSKHWFESAPHQLIQDPNFEILDTSSTAIRNVVKSKVFELPMLTLPEIYQYINLNQLYTT